jgi:hypothetical protein
MQVRISKPLLFGEGDQAKKLSKTVTVGEGGEARSFEVLELDLDGLTGNDVKLCAREASSAKGSTVRVLATDLEFHIQIAAKAGGIPVEALNQLGATDFVEVATTVQAFLTGSI